MSHELWGTVPHLILGGGSNTLFVGDIDRMVIKNDIVGLEIMEEGDDTITIRVGAGEDWNNLVMWSVDFFSLDCSSTHELGRIVPRTITT